ncbi:L-type lectin-domain containing receptor kinase S.1-like [Punica granatum]|uniref:non-specific serine/threonine protein kinase n=1 Tax=Punica granatum TaxID=22663 RepID=A0A6P8C0C0_PUNGR|nr:L-type lectin-domain containing receptor kinase S.1-like [Punica granatum]
MSTTSSSSHSRLNSIDPVLPPSPVLAAGRPPEESATMCSRLCPIIIYFLFVIPRPSLALDFLFDSFAGAGNATQILLINDARVQSGVVKLTNDSVQFSHGRAFYPSRIAMRAQPNSTSVTSFSTQFVFSVLPQIATSPGFGLAFVLSNSTSPSGALASQYFGLFTNAAVPPPAPLLAVEFDTGKNQELKDPDDNHVGIDLNNVESVVIQPAGYYNSSGDFVPFRMRTGQNVHAWIELDGNDFEINVTIAPLGVSRPSRPLISYKDPNISNYVSQEMCVGFSASKTNWVEAQRVLAWSLSDVGVARDINTTNLPVFLPESSSPGLSAGAIAGISIACVIFVLIVVSGCYWYWWRSKSGEQQEDEVEDWELEYWPHRFPYEELMRATDGFSSNRLLGSGGFGRVYKGILENNSEVAVKCVNHDSKQGLREFMAEISSMGRLQHKNLVQMRGWCRRGNELLIVYDYMPNGSLNRLIFNKSEKLLGWEQRRRILSDVAEGLNYLHHGWDQVVIHRDIKSSNVLLDSDMRGRLGDFGLAKLYQHGETPNTTRVVGTLGYLAPELVTSAMPSQSSDVYSFGVVVLEVVCGRRPIEVSVRSDDEVVLVDWVRSLYSRGAISLAVDEKIKGVCSTQEVETVLKLGLACCHPDPTRRPGIKDVVALLLGGDEPQIPM